MKNNIFRFLAIFILGLIQATILEDLKIKGAKPDLILILVLYFGIRSGIYTSQIMGFTGGFVIDLIYSMYFGVNMLIYTLSGFISGIFYKRVYIDTFFGTFIYIFVGTLIKAILYLFVAYVITEEISLAEVSSYFIDTVLIEMLINALLAPFIFNLLNKLDITGE